MAFESFRHWQARSIDQKQSASSLLLGLAGGAVAFTGGMLAQAKGYVGNLESLVYKADLILNALSITAGLAFTLNRVRDFDLTSQVARQRERDPKHASLKAMRATTRKWGRMTRRLYRWQVILFWMGMVAFIVLLFLQYRGVLFAPSHPT
jgi:hypothetical protein